MHCTTTHLDYTALQGEQYTGYSDNSVSYDHPRPGSATCIQQTGITT